MFKTFRPIDRLKEVHSDRELNCPYIMLTRKRESRGQVKEAEKNRFTYNFYSFPSQESVDNFAQTCLNYEASFQIVKFSYMYMIYSAISFLKTTMMIVSILTFILCLKSWYIDRCSSLITATQVSGLCACSPCAPCLLSFRKPTY